MVTKREEEVDARKEQDIKIVDNHVAMLKEHFDTVQIFVTKHETDDIGTIKVTSGSGDWYARMGVVWHWISQMRPPPLNDGEGERRDR